MLKYSCVCSLNTNETDTRMQSKSCKLIGIKQFIHFKFQTRKKPFKSSSTISHFLRSRYAVLYLHRKKNCLIYSCVLHLHLDKKLARSKGNIIQQRPSKVVLHLQVIIALILMVKRALKIVFEYNQVFRFDIISRVCQATSCNSKHYAFVILMA